MCESGVKEDRYTPYFLADGIHPHWRIFAQPIHHPETESERKYTKRQEAVRKDVERCVGVLQARFNVLRVENRMWYIDAVLDQGSTCVILHNMLVQIATDGELAGEIGSEGTVANIVEEFGNGTNGGQAEGGITGAVDRYMVRRGALTSESGHVELQEALIDHIRLT